LCEAPEAASYTVTFHTIFVPFPKHREYTANNFMKCWHLSLTESWNQEGVI